MILKMYMLNTRMEVFIMVNGILNIIGDKAWALLYLLMDQSTLDFLIMIELMVKAGKLVIMVVFMMVNGRMEFVKDMANLKLRLGINTKDFGKTIYKKVMALKN